MIFDYKFKGSRLLYHILFWIAYIVFFILQYSLFKKSDVPLTSTAGSLILTSVIDISAAYFTVYFLLPKFLFKKKYLIFGILFILSATVAIISQRVLMYYISYPVFYPQWLDERGTFWNINPFYSLLNIYTVVGLFASIKLVKYWFQNQQMKSELENKNKSSELALLRTQLNPHFLFNTLNNIDALILTNPEKASDAIIKLSDIMRFMLYDTNTDVVSLEKEISYLKSYIALQQMRYKDSKFVKFTSEGNCSGKTIAPMLFIPFVENAFKHGQKNVKSPGIEIHLLCKDDFVKFDVINHFDGTQEINKDKTPGIGLANTKRRLQLLYPEKHQLNVTQVDGFFTSSLKINYR